MIFLDLKLVNFVTLLIVLTLDHLNVQVMNIDHKLVKLITKVTLIVYLVIMCNVHISLFLIVMKANGDQQKV